MNNQNNNSMTEEVGTIASTALAAASKTPFRTGFMITLGMGLAKVVLALLFVAGLVSIFLVAGYLKN